jgi:hypothetical protein
MAMKKWIRNCGKENNNGATETDFIGIVGLRVELPSLCHAQVSPHKSGAVQEDSDSGGGR